MLIRFSHLLLSGLALVATGMQAQSASPNSLESALEAARWRQRVVLVCAASATDGQLQRQRELLAADRLGLAERDLLVCELLLPKLSAADRRRLRQLGMHSNTFRVLLIGKDGGVKRRDAQPVAPETLFGIIDQMPMRRQEMKESRN